MVAASGLGDSRGVATPLAAELIERLFSRKTSVFWSLLC